MPNYCHFHRKLEQDIASVMNALDSSKTYMRLLPITKQQFFVFSSYTHSMQSAPDFWDRR